MADQRNFLLGYGERLTEKIPPPRRNPRKAHPYTLDEAKEFLVPRLSAVADLADRLPRGVCPDDRTVVAVTLHPAYLAKTFFPDRLVKEAMLDPVGSRARLVTPRKSTRKEGPKPTVTSELYVATNRTALRAWADSASEWSDSSGVAGDVIKIEDVRIVPVQDRCRDFPSTTDDEPLLEVVLYAGAYRHDDYVLDGFREYLKAMDVRVDLDRRLHVGRLCFLPVRAHRRQIPEIAEFSFLRFAREMPALRRLTPGLRSMPTATSPVNLPSKGPVDPRLIAAVFDGGLPPGPELAAWASARKASGLGKAVPAHQEHGLAVTSALLFGPLSNGGEAETPPAFVHHFRVCDEKTAAEPQDQLFEVLKRIKTILEQGQYQFVNLSIGPDLPVDDNEVHVWTAVLDQLFASGRTLACVAAGNSGTNSDVDRRRVQPPGDAVNVLTVGACDRLDGSWRRAPYSSMGPGRSPGRVKPDILAFGGIETNPFGVLSDPKKRRVTGASGTSFASPFALRSALGVRAALGPVLGPLAIKALMIHRSERGVQGSADGGWGRVPVDPNLLLTCSDRSVTVVYQGELSAGEWRRVPIPVPPPPIPGSVEITATLCLATDTDPQDPIHYTRSGLDIVFRPDRTRKAGRSVAETARFFTARAFADEGELRRDAMKWETTLHQSVTKHGSGLNEPTLDIHYNAREAGAPARSGDRTTYALVVSVRAPQVRSLYDVVVRRYRTKLEILRPVLEIPIRVGGR